MLKILRYLQGSVEELILIGIIILNILDFLEIINPDWDYAKKIISLAALIYLLYKASITSLIIGNKRPLLDLSIMVSYLMLSIKDVLSYSTAAVTDMAEKGLNYWAELYPVDSATDYFNLTSHIGNTTISSLSHIPVESAGLDLARSVTVQISPFALNDIYIRVANNLGSQFYLIEPRFFVHRWHNLLIDNMLYLESAALIIGLVALALIALYMAVKLTINAPSLLHIIDEHGPPPSHIKQIALRFIMIFVALNFFYIAIFNLTVEWFAFAVDAPLIIIGLLFYMMVWLKHHKRFGAESIVFKIGRFGEETYQKFVSLFHSKRGLILGLAGILVLHLLTDIGNFIVPYTLGFHDPLYFQGLGPGHEPVFSLADVLGSEPASLYFTDIATSGQNLPLAFVYFMNMLAYTLLFLAPAMIWYSFFNNSELKINPGVIGAFYASVVILFLAPALTFGRLASEAGNIVGVDVTTSSLATLSLDLTGISIAGMLIFIVVLLLSLTRFKKVLLLGAFICSTLFFAIYIFNYFLDVFYYYLTAASGALNNGKIAIGLYMIVFMALTLSMYVGGFFAYLYECIKS